MKPKLIILLFVITLACNSNVGNKNKKQEALTDISNTVEYVYADKDSIILLPKELKRFNEFRNYYLFKDEICFYLGNDDNYNYDFILTEQFIIKLLNDLNRPDISDTEKNKLFSLWIRSADYLCFIVESGLCPQNLEDGIKNFLFFLNYRHNYDKPKINYKKNQLSNIHIKSQENFRRIIRIISRIRTFQKTRKE